MVKSLLYKDIYDGLLADLQQGTFPAGSKLPTVRELCQRFSVSHITVLRALRELSENGYIIPRGTTGFFAAVRGNYSARTRTLAAFIRPVIASNKDNYSNWIYAGLEKCAFADGYTILRPPENRLLLQLNLTRTEEELILRRAIEIQDSVDGIFLDDRITDEALQPHLKDFSKPVMIINRPTVLPLMAAYPPNAELMDKLLDHGMQLGYDVFVYATSNTFFGNILARKKAFDAYMNAHGLERDILEGTVIQSPETVKNKIREYIEKCNGKRPLFVCPADHVGRALADYISNLGYIFKKDVGLVSVEGLEMASQTSPRLTTIAFSPIDLGVLAMQKMLGKLSVVEPPDKPDNISIPFTLILGDTM